MWKVVIVYAGRGGDATGEASFTRRADAQKAYNRHTARTDLIAVRMMNPAGKVVASVRSGGETPVAKGEDDGCPF